MAGLNDTNTPGAATPSADMNAAPFPLLQPDITMAAGGDGAGPQHGKKRQRLLRGIQRISSSPSLVLGRPRSLSSPYPKHGTLSCVSLASSPSPFGQPSTGSSYFSHVSTTDGSAPTSVSGASAPGTPDYDDAESTLAIRRVQHPIMAPKIAALPLEMKKKQKVFNLWAKMPHEIRIQILSYLQPKELVRVSLVSRDFHKICFDGQLWKSFDATEFYREIPAKSLSKIIGAAGPFIKNLNLRGCVQVEQDRMTGDVVKSCKNIVNATFEGCRNFRRSTLHTLLRGNHQLVSLNLTGLVTVTNATCEIIARSCPLLERLNVSWCKQMDAEGIKAVVEGCHKLADLRAGEISGFNSLEVAQTLFETNKLERLVLAGCSDLDDAALKTMIHGVDFVIDLLTDRPIVPPRKLRHLDLSRCTNLTDVGVGALEYNVPDLEGLQLSGVPLLTDAALEPIFRTSPKLTHLELEDLSHLTSRLLSDHLAKSPCAPTLEHISISSCLNIGDSGVVPLLRRCTGLRSVFMDNTAISDLTLAEATAMVLGRSTVHPLPQGSLPTVGLHLVVYDCPAVTWSGVLEVLSRNAENIGSPSAAAGPPSEVITLKCFYGWQMTVDEHTKRVLRGDCAAALRLGRKWTEYMRMYEEAGIDGDRHRRRRLRNAQLMHANEENVQGRRRARTMQQTLGDTMGCLVM